MWMMDWLGMEVARHGRERFSNSYSIYKTHALVDGAGMVEASTR